MAKKNAWTCPRVLHYLSRIVGLCHNRAEFTGFRFKHKRLFENIAVSTDINRLCFSMSFLSYCTRQFSSSELIMSTLIRSACFWLCVSVLPRRSWTHFWWSMSPVTSQGQKGEFQTYLRPARLFLACRYWQNEYYCHVLGAGHWTHGHHFLWLLLNQWKNDTSWYPTSCGCTAAWRNSTSYHGMLQGFSEVQPLTMINHY